MPDDKREETTEEKRGAGRPTDCTPEIIERVAALVRAGNYVSIACGEAGICEKTYYNWLEWGAESKEPFATFLQSVTRAERTAEATAVAQLRQAGQDHRTRDGEVEVRVEQPDGSVNVYTETWVQGDWRAIAEYLKRRHTDRWGDKQRTEVVGDKRNPVEHNVNLTGDGLGQRIDALLARRANGAGGGGSGVGDDPADA